MARSKTIGLVFEAWSDLDRVVANVGDDDMLTQMDGGSAFAWTIGHVTNMVDAWINVRFQNRAPHPLIAHSRFRMGETGAAEDWPAIKAGVREVREIAREYLQGLAEQDLDAAVPYDGSLAILRGEQLTLRYALLRVAAHHYYHIGEIAVKLERLGHDVGGYPGPLAECI